MRFLLSSFALALFASTAYAAPVPVKGDVEINPTLGATSPPVPGSGLSIDVTTTLKPRSAMYSEDELSRGMRHLLAGEGRLASDVARFLTGHLSGFKGAYHWTAPSGWVRPTSYEFGLFHKDTGAWMNSQLEVLATLKRLAFVKLPIDEASPLFPLSHGHYPIRDSNRTRQGQFGYFNQDDVFVDLESKIDASILLGLCGYIKI